MNIIYVFIIQQRIAREKTDEILRTLIKLDMSSTIYRNICFRKLQF